MDHENGQTPCLLEVCVASLEDARTAAQYGATRIELNSALELGGLTPSIGVTECVVKTLAPTQCAVVTMVRPRPGGFVYNADEREVMLKDINRMINVGVDGVALGVLHADGRVDEQANRELIQPLLSAGREAVFHRAFDLTPDPAAALEVLIRLGFTRVLTSGSAATAQQGAETIKRLIEQAAGRIEVLPGSGISADNAAELIRTTGCNQVHASLRSLAQAPANQPSPSVRFNSAPPEEGAYHQTDATKVQAMVRVLKG